MLLAPAKAATWLLLGLAASTEIMALLHGTLSIWGTGCMNRDRQCCWFWTPRRFCCADYKWKEYTA
jgi:hypothetical protein